jgi:hypothetical protein
LPVLPDPFELGHPVPVSFILATSRRASVGVTSLMAYTNGFRFTVIAGLRDAVDSASSVWQVVKQARAARSAHRLPLSGLYLLRLSFSDGTTVDNGAVRTETQEEGVRSLTPLSAAGGGTQWKWDWFASPLPAPGTIKFEISWPEVELEGRQEVPFAELIHSAAQKSLHLPR